MKALKINYDNASDAVYIQFREVAPGAADNRVLSEDVTFDYDGSGRLLGIEILNASEVLGEEIIENLTEGANPTSKVD
ncbi:MAG: DUF2283 domain-containing protein [Planctomycetes bacterium]|nr:DUF2283 domain-containing protein [Planctomycetota bacterium]